VSVSFIGGGNQSTWRKPPTCHKSLTNFITLCSIKYTLPCVQLFELTTLVVISNDCTSSCKSNYHTNTTTTPSINDVRCCYKLKILYKSRYTISLIIIRSLRFTLKIVTARENPEYSTINNVTESKFFLYNFQFLINNKNVLVMF